MTKADAYASALNVFKFRLFEDSARACRLIFLSAETVERFGLLFYGCFRWVAIVVNLLSGSLRLDTWVAFVIFFSIHVCEIFNLIVSVCCAKLI